MVLQRVLVQGGFEDFLFYGRVCVVRWSFLERVFGSGKVFGERLADCLTQVESFYGGVVTGGLSRGVKEEYVAVLILRSKGTKRIRPSLLSFSVWPRDCDRKEFHGRGVGCLTLYVPQPNIGSHRYREFRRSWCYDVRGSCAEHFGSWEDALGGDLGGDGSEGRAVMSGLVARVGEQREEEVVSGEGRRGSSVRENRRGLGGYGSIGRFGGGLLMKRGDMRGKDVDRLRALVRMYRLMVVVAQLEYEAVEMGGFVSDEEDDLMRDVV